VTPDADDIVARVRRGDPRAIGRAISAAENEAPGNEAVLGTLFRHSGHAYVLGVTGPPGAGKSSLVDGLVRLLRARYDIPLERIYAHNWIDYKDARYCEGCALAALARQWGP